MNDPHDNVQDDKEILKKLTKPTVKLLGENGNVFNLLGKCTSALKRAGMRDEADQLAKAVFAAGSYDEALQLMMAAVDVE